MFVLPELPYPANALEPVLSGELMTVHHDKHHATYVNNLNKILADSGRNPSSLEQVVLDAAAAGEKKLFNNAAQAWNHAFFWESMAAEPTKPSGALASAIDTAFGDLAGLKTKFVEEGVNHFASGWVWLMAKDGALSVISTHDAGCPITDADGGVPILVCDVWEHAYYLVHKQDRKGFLEQWFDKLANWSFAEAQLSAPAEGGFHYPLPVNA